MDVADLDLKFFQPEEDHVFLPAENLNLSIDSWQSIVVLHPIDFRLSVIKLRDYISKVWRPKGKFLIHIAPGFYYTVKFEDAEDCSHVLKSSTYSYFGKLLMVFKWRPGYEFDKVRATRVQFWVKLFNLEMEMWSNEGLSRIASYLGDLIRLDIRTANKTVTRFARVLIGVDINYKIISQVPIILHNGSNKVIRVEYEFIPPCCNICQRFGHKSSIHDKSSDPTWTAKDKDNDAGPSKLGTENSGEVDGSNGSNVGSDNGHIRNTGIDNDVNNATDGSYFLNSELPDKIRRDIINHVADNIKEPVVNEEIIDVSEGIEKNEEYLRDLKGKNKVITHVYVTPPKRATRSNAGIK